MNNTGFRPGNSYGYLKSIATSQEDLGDLTYSPDVHASRLPEMVMQGKDYMKHVICLSPTRGRRRGPVRGIRPMEPVRLAEKLRGFEGNWVALKGGEVVAAGRTADVVMKEIRSRRIEDATILRVPGEDEPELVGLG
jgi:hypothetical protein